jgi:hypothetical protein
VWHHRAMRWMLLSIVYKQAASAARGYAHYSSGG